MNVNILLVIVAIAAFLKAIDGYKKGMVKEIISLVSMAILCAVVAILVNGINNYLDGKILAVVVAGVALAVIGWVHHLLGVVFFSAKVLSKLPIVSFVNKLLGIIFGVFEVVLLLWTVYTFVMMLDMGAIGQIILSYTQDSELLTFVYRYNYLAYGIELLLEKFQFIPLISGII